RSFLRREDKGNGKMKNKYIGDWHPPIILVHPPIPYPERRRRESWFLPRSWSILLSLSSWFKYPYPERHLGSARCSPKGILVQKLPPAAHFTSQKFKKMGLW